MSTIKDIEDILIAIQVKQSRYKYDLIQETIFNSKSKILSRRYSLIKYHKEKIEDEETGETKTVKVEDDKVRGNTISILKYMVEELKGTDDS